MATGWSDDELEASVGAYVQMLRWEVEGKQYVKSDVYRRLSATFPRTTKSFEFRMQNISYVVLLMGRQWLGGLKPASNVGSNIAARLVKHLTAAINTDEKLAPRLSKSALRLAVSALAKDGPLPFPFSQDVQPEDLGWNEEMDEVWTTVMQADQSIQQGLPPEGAMSPRQAKTFVQAFIRDQDVIDWVLQRANGVCECCNTEAPFLDKDELPFLEVHHLRRLADGGSDRPSNAVAVCPNCHRRLHYGLDKSEQLAGIYDRVEGVSPE